MSQSDSGRVRVSCGTTTPYLSDSVEPTNYSVSPYAYLAPVFDTGNGGAWPFLALLLNRFTVLARGDGHKLFLPVPAFPPLAAEWHGVACP